MMSRPTRLALAVLLAFVCAVVLLKYVYRPVAVYRYERYITSLGKGVTLGSATGTQEPILVTKNSTRKEQLIYFDRRSVFAILAAGLAAGAVWFAFHSAFRSRGQDDHRKRTEPTVAHEIWLFFSLLLVTCSVPAVMISMQYLPRASIGAMRLAAYMVVTGLAGIYMVYRREEFESVVRGAEFLVAMNVGAELAIHAFESIE